MSFELSLRNCKITNHTDDSISISCVQKTNNPSDIRKASTLNGFTGSVQSVTIDGMEYEPHKPPQRGFDGCSCRFFFENEEDLNCEISDANGKLISTIEFV